MPRRSATRRGERIENGAAPARPAERRRLPDAHRPARYHAQPVMAPGRLRRDGAQARRTTSSRATSSRSCWPSASPTPFTLPPFDLYRALRRINPSPFLYFLDLPGFALVGSSPEILVRVRDGEVTIRPIAGTRPRGATPDEDAENEASLLADPKERAEHLMLLDLGRNDVGRVALAGTVTVTDSYTVERYSHVMHIVSQRRRPARSGKGRARRAVRRLPGRHRQRRAQGPRLRDHRRTGTRRRAAPMPAASAISRPTARWISCIVLRTAVVKDGVMHVQAGAGIVADSVPEYEQRECEAKAGALIAAAREAMSVAGDRLRAVARCISFRNPRLPDRGRPQEPHHAQGGLRTADHGRTAASRSRRRHPLIPATRPSTPALIKPSDTTTVCGWKGTATTTPSRGRRGEQGRGR